MYRNTILISTNLRKGIVDIKDLHKLSVFSKRFSFLMLKFFKVPVTDGIEGQMK